MSDYYEQRAAEFADKAVELKAERDQLRADLAEARELLAELTTYLGLQDAQIGDRVKTFLQRDER